MAAYAALLSLQPKIERHLLEHPGYLPIPISTEFDLMKDALEEIGNTVLVLEMLDRSRYKTKEMRVRTWDLVESQLLKRFPCEYPMVQFAVKDVEHLVEFMADAQVDASDIERVRDEAVCRLEHVLESLVSSLQLDQPLHQILAELERAKQQIKSFIQTAKKIKDGGRKSLNTIYLSDEFPKITTDLLPGIRQRCDKMLSDLEATVQSLDMRRGNSSRERMDALELQIREAVCKIEDLLDNRLIDQFPVPFPLDLHQVQKHIPPFTRLLRKLKQEYMNELIDPLPEEGCGDSDDIVSLRKSYGKNKSNIVGLYDEGRKILEEMYWEPKYLKIVVLFGMGGIGKTTVAEKVFDHQLILESFDLRVWVEVGRIYQLKRIKQSILEQVLSRDKIDEMLAETEDDRLDAYLRESLTDKRYLIVLDDVWDGAFWNHLVKKLFPDDDNGSRVLLTTRRKASGSQRAPMRFMSNEESWELLCEKVFCGKSCPPLLKDAGKKIADSCEGHPLTIVTVGELLSEVEMTPEKWNELADNKNSLIEKACERMSKVLLPSYTCLTQYLKACFLYMVVFPLNYEISLSELFKLWVAEKFPKSHEYRFEVEKIIQDLSDNSLLMQRRERSSFGIKTWSLHSSFWHLCKREALKNKFSYTIGCRGDSLLEGIKNQQRLCVHKSILFGIKDVHESIASISTARSLICTGPPHQYPVPICFNLKLLRILNALSIRLYDFPIDVLKLFQLKYLALTCYGNLPPSISKLWNLEFLIILRHHLIIGSSEGSSYVPVEIWDMKELKHLQIMGSDLPEPCEGTSLPNLETLVDVSARSCKKSVFQGTPKLKKLGIRIELTPDGHATETLHCFDHISCLKKLESLKCAVVNPTFGPHITPPPLAIFPSSLQKLSLSGFGYPWEDMRWITSLPNLHTLKLRCYAFRGPELEIKDNGFPNLWSLLIEDTDLVNWTVEPGSLPKITSTFLKSCYKLEKVTWNKFDRPGTKLHNCYKLGNIDSPWIAVTSEGV